MLVLNDNELPIVYHTTITSKSRIAVVLRLDHHVK